MIKYIIALLTLSLGFSCSSNTNSDASDLCNCYGQVFRASSEDQQELNDSCMVIYKTILEKYKNNPEGMKDFSRTYKDCQ